MDSRWMVFCCQRAVDIMILYLSFFFLCFDRPALTTRRKQQEIRKLGPGTRVCGQGNSLPWALLRLSLVKGVCRTGWHSDDLLEGIPAAAIPNESGKVMDGSTDEEEAELGVTSIAQ